MALTQIDDPGATNCSLAEIDVVTKAALDIRGDIFYVAMTGLDTNNGKTWATAFFSIDRGVNACTAGAGDAVFVAPGAYNENANGATGVQCDVSDMGIFGIGGRVVVVNQNTADNGAVFTITADAVKLVNMFILKSEDTSLNSRCVHVDGSHMAEVIDCLIGVEAVATHSGIHVDGDSYVVVYGPRGRSVIYGTGVGAGFGIRLGDSSNCRIRDTYINDFVTGISLEADCDEAVIESTTTVSACTTGVLIAAGAQDNALNLNIVDCTTAITDNSGNATNQWGGSVSQTYRDNISELRVQYGISGTVFYVSTGGNDSNGGKSWDDAFLTIDYAVNQCTAGAGDGIIVAPGTYDEIANGVNGVVCDITGVHIIGVGYVLVTNTTNTGAGNVFRMTASNVTLVNLSIMKGETVNNNSVLVLITGAVAVNLLNCIIIVDNDATFTGVQFTGGAAACNLQRSYDDGFSAVYGVNGVGVGAHFDTCTDCGLWGTTIGSLTTGIHFDSNAETGLFDFQSTIVNCATGITLSVGATANILYGTVGNCTTDYTDNSGNATNDKHSSLTDLHMKIGHIPSFTGDIWYVDGTNGLDTNGGTEPGEAFKTIAVAIVAAGAGDAISIFAGTYDEAGLDMAVAGLEMWCEVGVFIVDTTPGTCLTVSATGCKVRGAHFVQAGAVGLQLTATGIGCIIEDCVSVNCTVGFDIDGHSNQLFNCTSAGSTVTQFDISQRNTVLRNCYAAGTGTATRGYYLSNTACTRCLLKGCDSIGNTLTGFEIVAGVDNCAIVDCSSGGSDGGRLDAGEDISWARWSHDEAGVEKRYPFTDGEGGGSFANVVTDAADETNGPATFQNYYGEPSNIVPVSTFATRWSILGVRCFIGTASKIFRSEALFIHEHISSAKNGGVAWDEGATALTVADASLFAAGDYVWVYSTYKINGEIQIVVSAIPGTNIVTIVREASPYGAPNTGLRWNHTTNAPGTEMMYLLVRPGNSVYEGMEFDVSGASAKVSVAVNFAVHKALHPNDGMLIRAVNATDGFNGSNYDCSVAYDDS